MSHPSKHYLIVNHSASFDHIKARESLDAALILASYDMHVSLCFIGDGVFQTIAKQNAELIGAKDFIASFKALHFYDIEDIYVSETCLSERQLSGPSAFNDASLVTNSQITALIDAADVVLTF
ncbi:sulfurtransferase complex subunit TusC [Thalassotalea ponticola]|uniref:sulfurtransferase complex subunit TusC n=1 Tax=Thalassotalea ponticola TaxID=1523392 RepID=UPI0025B3E5C1|nr:sulfurtransferase complex subunit TusC [Thalassotalea ponticola]MDN3651461.1 sulfurtransferase complex subunit TusC [Thalassotalea ponticola]